MELSQYGERVLLVYGKSSIKRIPCGAEGQSLYDHVLQVLRAAGKQVVELGGVSANPRYSELLEGARLARENRVDLILAIGGGSVIDCAKGISCAAYAEGDVWERYYVRQEKVNNPIIPVGSILTMAGTGSEMNSGSVSQIKEVAACLLRFAKQSGVPVILIGHITKDGYIAGPKILEHIVDVVLQFEGENRGAYRILRSIKNRFGSTSELAVFEMTGNGLREVANPSQMLIPMHGDGLSGIAVASTLDGTRPLLFEVQALVSSAVYGTAQRSATGFDVRRLNMLLAVLEKRAGFHLSAKDVFLNMAGGLRVNDPSCDLAVVCAVLSSNFDLCIPPDLCFAAEVGLSGEIRPVNQTDRRIQEAARLGFKTIYISSFSSVENPPEGIRIVKVADIPSLVKALFR